jgi:4-hydroxy-4-methyl-2-oxoglutarate aldolase
MPSKPYIVAEIARADQEVIQRLGAHGVATVHEANGRTGLMHGLRAVTPGVRVAGSAVTCLNYAGDNLMLFAALDLCLPGDILIAAVTSPSNHGMFGELLATSCRARGVVAVVLDAGSRDTDELQEMGFPVWSRAISATGTEKSLPGWTNIPVCCGGTIVNPGDVVVADSDGIVVVDREEAAEILAAADKRQSVEQRLRDRLASGESGMDLGRYRARLTEVERRPTP